MGKDKPTGGKAAAAKEAKDKAAVAAAKEKGVEMMEVRHILVEKHAKALEVLEILNSGDTFSAYRRGWQFIEMEYVEGKMAFNEAAREHSIDKAGRSGLLGWKRRNELDQDFWAAALEVPEGKYTPEPVKTQYGYHIIKVEARK